MKGQSEEGRVKSEEGRVKSEEGNSRGSGAGFGFWVKSK